METRPKRRPSAELRLAVLCSIDHAPGNNITQRIRAVSYRQHIDPITGQAHQFTWRTIQSWYSRHKKDGITVIENKTRKDRFTTRKISVAQLAEAIKETLGDINPNKVGRSLKSALYKTMIKKGLITRAQIAPPPFIASSANTTCSRTSLSKKRDCPSLCVTPTICGRRTPCTVQR